MEPVNMWDFISLIQEDLGYKRLTQQTLIVSLLLHYSNSSIFFNLFTTTNIYLAISKMCDS